MWQVVQINSLELEDRQLTEEEFVAKYMKNLRKGVSCKKCGERFLGPRSFRIHARSLHPMGIKTAESHVPSTEDNSFTDENVNSYSKKKKKYLCRECGKSFIRKFHLKVHTRVHTKERPYVCKKCNRRFTHNQSLSKHLLAHAEEESEIYVCTECDERFSEKSKLTVHARLHVEERQLACDQCEKRFDSKKALSEHSGIHSEKKQFVCSVCKAHFNSQYGLFAHMRAHKETSYTCPKCGKRFKFKVVFERHVRSHLEEKPLSSTQSSNSISDSHEPQKHLRTQNSGNKKSYTCTVCGKIFSMKKHLVSHLLTHQDKKPFSCPYCSKGFKSKYALKYHVSHAVCSKQ